ncbi:hypothetical protein GGD64_005056 [Bradyrhizobium sp. CIR3A]|nr:hypothetical protein [Bradyrhizobium sp. CIR3A]NYG47282.1 hypothetical protein [Bradyrhizobium sp. IAR9]
MIGHLCAKSKPGFSKPGFACGAQASSKPRPSLAASRLPACEAVTNAPALPDVTPVRCRSPAAKAKH